MAARRPKGEPMKPVFVVGMTCCQSGRAWEVERFPSLVDAQTYADMSNRREGGGYRYWVALPLASD
jgi:hypothetical protein